MRSVFETLVNEYATGIIYSCAYAVGNERAYRANEFEQSATKNADKMIDSLRLQYNTARQLAITNEIAEISAAKETFDRGI